jgi:Uma2 family endonuclease
MQKPAKKYYTPEEYFALEENAEYKSEYYKGEIFAFAGGSFNHNLIQGNLFTILNQARKKHNCFVFSSDMKLWIAEKELITYPDIMVVCYKPEFYPDRNDTIVNPLIICEVLSKSTENYDRGNKFLFYRSIPTFQEYILIDQYSFHIEHFYMETKAKWSLTEYDDTNDILKFFKINFQIPLKNIYDLVELNRV